MEQNSQQFENLLRKSLTKSKVSPSSHVLRKLRFKLWVADFFSGNLRKFNFVYASAIIGGAILVMLYSGDQKQELTEPVRQVALEESNIPLASTGVEEVPSEVVIDEVFEEPVLNTPEIAGEIPMPAAAFAPSTHSGCAPLTVEFRNQSHAAESYEWDFGNGVTFAEENPEFTFEEPGRYVAMLTATGTEGEKDVYKQTIDVYRNPVAQFDIDMDQSDVIEKKIHFVNQSEGAGNYSWFFGDRYTSTLAEPVHTYRDYKSYDVMMIARSDQGCADTVRLKNTFIEKDYRLAFNDYFRPYLHGKSGNGYYDRARSDASIFGPRHNGVLEYQLTIWSPKGEEVFKTNTIKQGWNGYIEGRLASQGPYSYEAIGVYPNGQAFKQTGIFNVILEDIY